jgi:ribosomal subunit interface protein
MNVLVHSKTLQVTEGIRTFVSRQVSKISKLSQPVQEIRVFLENVRTTQGLNQEAKVKVKISLPGRDVFVSSRAKDLYFAISQAIEDGARAVRKTKERRIKKKMHQRPKLLYVNGKS